MTEKTNDDNMEAIAQGAARYFSEHSAQTYEAALADVRTVIKWDRRHATRAGMTLLSNKLSAFIRNGAEMGLIRTPEQIADALEKMLANGVNWGEET